MFSFWKTAIYYYEKPDKIPKRHKNKWLYKKKPLHAQDKPFWSEVFECDSIMVYHIYVIRYSCDTVFESDTGKIDIRPLFVVLSSDLPQAPDKENTLCFYNTSEFIKGFEDRMLKSFCIKDTFL